MTFAYPWVLPVGAVLLALLGWAAVRGERARRVALSRFGEIDILGRGSFLVPPRSAKPSTREAS